ncbi:MULTISPECIES: hypothetical protein [Actinoalloteichus]|uniref:hypothetical protein n=1 Tax=Actinoalloteichus TaxID=65496 RepID=UPI00267D4A56
MSESFDPAGDWPADPADRAAVWRYLCRYLGGLGSSIAPEDGCPADELDAAERRLGLPLPAALREFYGLLGRRTDVTSAQDTLLPPDRLHVDEHGGLLVFREENQDTARWGVAVDQLAAADPPVLLQHELSAGNEDFLPSVSLAAVELVLSESLFGPAGVVDNRYLDADDIELVERYCRRLPMPEYPVWAVPGSAVRWFTAPDLVVRDDGRSWLWVRARTPAALAALREAVPGEWMGAD